MCRTVKKRMLVGVIGLFFILSEILTFNENVLAREKGSEDDSGIFNNSISSSQEYSAFLKHDKNMADINEISFLIKPKEGNNAVEKLQSNQGISDIYRNNISTRDGTYAAIKEDGSLWMWGDNRFGQLGDGTTEYNDVPNKIMDNVRQVCVGGDYCAAIQEDGSLWMWGDNRCGKLGDGSNEDKLIPIKIMDNVKQVSLGTTNYSAAIKEDGSLWMWGSNGICKKIDYESEDIILIPKKIMDNVRQVYLGDEISAAVKEDGSLWMWGSYSANFINDGRWDYMGKEPREIMKKVRMVCLSDCTCAVIKEDGSLWIWWCDGSVGALCYKDYPVKMMDNVKQISVIYRGSHYYAAIKEDGTLWGWGGYSDDPETPEKIMDNVVQVANGAPFTVIKEDGSLWSELFYYKPFREEWVKWDFRVFEDTEKNKCTITFNSNGGSYVPSQTVNSGEYATKPTKPTREGYTFDGWYKDSGLTEKWKFKTDVVTSDITLYAKWKAVGQVDELNELFNTSSALYNKDLALLSAELSDAAEDYTGDNITKKYEELGFESSNIKPYNYGSDYAFAIASCPLSDSNLLIVTARGSKTPSEYWQDLTTGVTSHNFMGVYSTFDAANSFQESIWKGINSYLDNHPELEENGKKIKILVTGHSLGGAAANLVAARMNILLDRGEFLSAHLTSRDVYAYTFGAIDAVSQYDYSVTYVGTVQLVNKEKCAYDVPIKNGFENIHNVYNEMDSFAPNMLKARIYGSGRVFDESVFTINGKFGHIHLFNRDYGEITINPMDTTNHNMPSYINAVNTDYLIQSCDNTGETDLVHDVVACPVDVEVYKGDELVGRVVNNMVDTGVTTIPLYVYNDVKHFFLPTAKGYSIRVKATDSGSMSFITEGGSDQLKGTRRVDNIELVRDKTFYVPENTTEKAENTKIYVMDDQGAIASEVKEDGKEVALNIYVTKQKIDLKLLFGKKYDKYMISPRKAAKVKKNTLILNESGDITITGYIKAGKGALGGGESIKLFVEKPTFTGKKVSLAAGSNLNAGEYITGTSISPTIWMSSKPEVAYVNPNSGKITALKKGKAKITAVYGTGKGAAKYSFILKVVKAP